MGYNLHSACHHCRERVTHLRGKEGTTLQAFYQRHKDCLAVGHTVPTISDHMARPPFWVESDTYTDLTQEWWEKYFPELT